MAWLLQGREFMRKFKGKFACPCGCLDTVALSHHRSIVIWCECGIVSTIEDFRLSAQIVRHNFKPQHRSKFAKDLI